MKYILIFWLAHNQPSVATMDDPMACVQGLRILQDQFAGLEGLCLPSSYKGAKQYSSQLKDLNATIPN